MNSEQRMRKRRHPSKGAFLLLAAVVVFAVLLAVIIRAIFTGTTKVLPEPGECIMPDISVTFSTLDKKAFSKDRDFIRYYDGETEALTGIDVSFAQKEIDWSLVGNSGIDFAMIRAGYRGYESGKLNTDDFFARNITGALNAGIEAGVYWFSQALNEAEAVEEAEYVLKLISPYSVTFPVAFDWEPVSSGPARTDKITGDELEKCALAFCRTIEEAGYSPVIYASLNLLREKYDKYTIDNISEYELWLAEYKNRPEYPYQFRMWQYTDEAVIDGIKYPVDLNLYFR